MLEQYFLRPTELTDAQALELQVIENVQRVDVHPLSRFAVPMHSFLLWG